MGVLFLAAILVPSHGSPASIATSSCGPGWRIVPSPNPGGTAGLASVVSFPRGTAWAVGLIQPPTQAPSSTVALHQDIADWEQVPTPNPYPNANRLDAVAGLADDDVWAVGSGTAGGGSRSGTLIEHWDGAAWSVVRSPNPPQRLSFLDAASVQSRTDAWAVGNSQDALGTSLTTLIEHWNGRRWTILPSPNPQAYNSLRDVAARSPSDAWAVGSSFDATGGIHNLVLHWDGIAWAVVNAPSPGLEDNTLTGVVALGPNDAWSVGYAADHGVSSRFPLTLHWDGASWNQVPNPTLSGQLNSVAAAPAGRLWAAGYREIPPTTLIERWDGSAWRLIRSQNRHGVLFSALFGIALGASADSAWAVGSSADYQSRGRPLVEHPGRCSLSE